MSGFEDFTVQWDGREHVIRAFRVLGAVARVEEHLTFLELMQFAHQQNVPFAKLASAYAALLQCAGVRIKANEVYRWMLRDIEKLENAVECLNTLMALMVPPELRAKLSESKAEEAEQITVNPPAAAAAAPSSGSSSELSSAPAL